MNGTSNTSTVTRWTNRVLIGLFMVLLWLPSLDSIFHFDWTPPRSENRAMAVFPKPPQNWHGLQAYISGLEAYFNDHFGCRKCLVQWHNKLQWALFKDRNTRNVLVGKNGWLFTTDAQMIDHYSGQLQLTQEELHDWQVLLEKRRDWLAKRGIAYLFVVPPDKHTIYPEELPDWVTKVRPQTMLDQFFAYMHEHSTVHVLDLRHALIEAKKIHPDYLKTDTHWNFFGGFIAYQEVMRALDQEVPGVEPPLPLSDFTMTKRPEPGGDLARILGLSMAESNAYVPVPKPGLPKFTTTHGPTDRPKDPRITDNPLAKGRVFIFHDSYGLSWVRFLGYNFNHVTYRWQYDINPAWIEQDKPNIVINEMLERFFNIEHPKEMMEKEGLN
jgi:hypothetical protein